MFQFTRPLAAALLLALPLMSARAADNDELTRELLRIHNAPSGHDFAYWLPAAAFPALVPNMDAAASKAIAGAFAGYELFLVEHMSSDANGNEVASDAEPAPMHLKLASGRVLDAQRESDLTPMLLKMANAFKTVMAKDGSGKNMRIIVFKMPTLADEPRIDSPKPSVVTLLVGDVPMVWHLPLAGVGPSAVDPDSGERFPGGFAFNPYTGAALKRE